jgi:hypothetical protein
MIDIVIPFINGEDSFEELRYAIRSIENNFQDLYFLTDNYTFFLFQTYTR